MSGTNSRSFSINLLFPLSFITVCGIIEDVKTQSSALPLPDNYGQFISMICPFNLLNIWILHLLFSLFTVLSPSQTTITSHLDCCNKLLNDLYTITSTHSQTTGRMLFSKPNLTLPFLCLKPFNDLPVVFGIVVKNP